MVGFELTLDPSRMIEVPGSDRIPLDERASWARDAAQALGAIHGLERQRIESIEAGLEAIRHLAARSAGTYIAIYDPLTRLLAPLRLITAERELDEAEQHAYLHPPTLLGGQMRMTPPTALGIGCSSTFPTTRGDMAEIRWIFMAEHLTLLAVLAPVALSAALSAGVTAEDLLVRLKPDEEVRASAAFDPRALVADAAETQPSWPV